MPNKIYEAAEKFFNEVSKQFNRLDLSTSLEELLNTYGDALDKIILREEQDKRCTYLGGELRISRLDDKNYDCGYSLYFEDADESVHTLEAKTKPLEMKFLTKDFQQSLITDGVLKFEIDEPSEEARLKYKQQLR
ncbi:MAG: hypothetical protein IKD73_00220 [Selenomonadaceae bacterium]|nr:hypothetical protein [Selenomonadaceae bacterium]